MKNQEIIEPGNWRSRGDLEKVTETDFNSVIDRFSLGKIQKQHSPGKMSHFLFALSFTEKKFKQSKTYIICFKHGYGRWV